MKATRKAPATARKKKSPKILSAVAASAEEFQAAYKFTPAEIRRADRILESVRKKRSTTAK